MSTPNNFLMIAKPLSITDTMLDSTNIPEDDYAAWVNSTTYSTGARVIMTTTHRIYESLADGNQGHSPDTSPDYWLDVSATNRWKAFDSSSTSQTLGVEESGEYRIVYTLKPAQILNCLAIMNITGGNEILIQCVDTDYGLIYDKDIDISPLPPSPDWWSWFFGERYQKTQYIAIDFVALMNTEIMIEVMGTSELAIGMILLAKQKRYGLGITKGAQIGIQDYSIKETNEFGDTYILERPFARRATFELLMHKNQVDSFYQYISSIRAQSCLCMIGDGYEALSIFGFYKTFNILIEYPDYVVGEIEWLGLT